MQELENRTRDVISDEKITFHQLNLKDDVLHGLDLNNFKYPSPIQLKAIPVGLLGFDLIIQAKSGTGKTCVFGVLALERLNMTSTVCQILIISPTREIAFQSKNVITALGSYIDNLTCNLFIGGVKVNEDLKNLKKCQIVVGTPGRIKYLIEENHLQTDHIRLLILDEADMLFTENFQNDINFIYNCLPLNKQMITLSATYTEEMINIITERMNSPVMVRLSSNEKAALLGIRHYLKIVEDCTSFHQIFWAKTEALLDILSSVDFQQCIVFSNHQSVAQDLCDALECKGWATAYISGCLDQAKRIDTYNKLKNYHCRILITTDLTSRGIDAENVNLVVNMEIPWEIETYLHRMGRAGRYGTYGAVINLVLRGEEMDMLMKVKDNCNIDLNLLPEQIPFDLLRDQTDENQVSDVEIKRLEKSGSRDVFKFFAKLNTSVKTDIESNANSSGDKEFVMKMFSRSPQCLETPTIEQFEMMYDNHVSGLCAQNYAELDSTTDLSADVEMAACTNKKLLEYISGVLNKNNVSSNKQDEDKQVNNKTEIDSQYDHLKSWAVYYWNEYQRVSCEIKNKTQQLNELLLE